MLEKIKSSQKLEKFNGLPKYAKLAVIGGIVLLIFLIVFTTVQVTKNPIVGKWETDYEHYNGAADDSVIHLTFSNDGTFVFNNDGGTYTTKDGILVFDYSNPNDDTVMQEYEITRNNLVIDQVSFLKKVKTFEKQFK
jgi:hypothetical protein